MIEPLSSDSLRKRTPVVSASKADPAPRKRVAVTLSRGHLRFVEVHPRITEPRTSKVEPGR